MLGFMIGFIVGAVFTLFCIGVWVVDHEEDKEREENEDDKTK